MLQTTSFDIRIQRFCKLLSTHMRFTLFRFLLLYRMKLLSISLIMPGYSSKVLEAHMQVKSNGELCGHLLFSIWRPTTLSMERVFSIQLDMKNGVSPCIYVQWYRYSHKSTSNVTGMTLRPTEGDGNFVINMKDTAMFVAVSVFKMELFPISSLLSHNSREISWSNGDSNHRDYHHSQLIWVGLF